MTKQIHRVPERGARAGGLMAIAIVALVTSVFVVPERLSAAEPASAWSMPDPAQALATTRGLIAAAGGYDHTFRLITAEHVAVPFYRRARREIHCPPYTELTPTQCDRLLGLVETHVFNDRLDLAAALGDADAARAAWQTFMLVAMPHEHTHGLRAIASAGRWQHWHEEQVAIRIEQAVLHAAIAQGDWAPVAAERYQAFNQALLDAIDPALLAALPPRGSEAEHSQFLSDLSAVMQVIEAIVIHVVSDRPITNTFDHPACQRVMAIYTRERLARWAAPPEDLTVALRAVGLAADQVTPAPARGPKIK